MRYPMIVVVACCCFTESLADQPRGRETDTRWQRYAKTRHQLSQDLELQNHDAFGLVVAVSPEFKLIAYSDFVRRSIIVASFDKAKTELTLPGHAKSTQCVAFSGDGNRLVSGGVGDVIVWDASTGAKIAGKFVSEKHIRCIACSPDGKLVAAGGDDNEIGIWSLPDLMPVRRLKGHTSHLRHGCLVWSRDGRVVLSGSWDGSIRLWDVGSGQNVATMNAKYGRVMSIALSPKGDRALASYLSGPDQPVNRKVAPQ